MAKQLLNKTAKSSVINTVGKNQVTFLKIKLF